MRDLKPKYLLESFTLTFDNKNNKKKKTGELVKIPISRKICIKTTLSSGLSEGRRSIKVKILGKILLAWDIESVAFICSLLCKLDTIGRDTKGRQQKVVELFIVMFSIANFRKYTFRKLHRRVSI